MHFLLSSILLTSKKMIIITMGLLNSTLYIYNLSESIPNAWYENGSLSNFTSTNFLIWMHHISFASTNFLALPPWLTTFSYFSCIRSHVCRGSLCCFILLPGLLFGLLLDLGSCRLFGFLDRLLLCFFIGPDLFWFLGLLLGLSSLFDLLGRFSLSLLPGLIELFGPPPGLPPCLLSGFLGLRPGLVLSALPYEFFLWSYIT